MLKTEKIVDALLSDPTSYNEFIKEMLIKHLDLNKSEKIYWDAWFKGATEIDLENAQRGIKFKSNKLDDVYTKILRETKPERLKLLNKPKIETYLINTGMGKLSKPLPFLNEIQNAELNSIGYSSRMLDGTSMTRVGYLESLNLGTFDIVQTKFDNGDFSESFTLTRVL